VRRGSSQAGRRGVERGHWLWQAGRQWTQHQYKIVDEDAVMENHNTDMLEQPSTHITFPVTKLQHTVCTINHLTFQRFFKIR
jgi:hypothetical protein